MRFNRIPPTFLLILGLLSTNMSYGWQVTKHAVDSMFNECTNEPGCAMAIFQNGKLIQEAYYGYSNLDYNIPFTEKTAIDMGVLTMHMTAAGILILEDQGLVNLNAAIHTYLPELNISEDKPITIWNLLTHTAGFRDIIAIIMARGQSLDSNIDNSVAYEILLKQNELCMEPGSDLRFSQSNYLVLAKLIEKVSGKPYAEFMAETLFQPAGMTSTFVQTDAAAVVPQRAYAYSGSDGNYTRYNPITYTVNGHGRVYSNMRDLQRWVSFIKEKEVNGKTLIEGLTQTHPLNSGAENNYALGLQHGFFRGQPFFGHNGYWGGFSSMYLEFPESDLSIVTMSVNNNISAPGKAYDVASLLDLSDLGNRKLSESRAAEIVELTNEDLAKFAGEFFSEKFGYLRRTYVENGGLKYEIEPDVVRDLVAINNHQFVVANQSTATVFSFSRQGEELHLQILVDGIPEYDYEAYERADHSDEQLDAFSGTYYSPELEATYEIRNIDGTLNTYFNSESLVEYASVSTDLFTSAHDGYIKFIKNRRGKVTGFELGDYSLGSMDFIRQ